MASGSGSPCGACKFLRRKCASDCVFAPYFCSEEGPTRFANIHKVFGASNVSKLLLHMPSHERYEAMVTIAYEAQARVDDPVYGCVAHIFALQQQVASLQAQVMHLRAQIAHNIVSNSRSIHNLCQGSNGVGSHLLQPHIYYGHSNTSSNSSLNHSDAISLHEAYLKDEDSLEPCMKKRAQCNDLGDLHDLASRMMRT